jgi:hypothetical protein
VIFLSLLRIQFKKYTTFVTPKVVGLSLRRCRHEKGIRCESGTVPAAVCSTKSVALLATGRYSIGKAQQMEQVRRPAFGHAIYTRGFRVKMGFFARRCCVRLCVLSSETLGHTPLKRVNVGYLSLKSEFF